MKKFLKGLLAIVLVLTLAGCGEKGKENNENGENAENENKVYTMAELKEAASKAGYVTNDYVACFTGLTEDQMEGFTVDIQKSAKETASYCVIVAKSEQYAKQACETVSNEYNTCIRSGSAVVFPEYTASNDVLKMLKSIVEGSPIDPVKYESAE